jgi:hypothetical protein
VNKRYGRKVVKKLLAVVNNEEALNLLNTTEGEFLEAWKARVSSPSCIPGFLLKIHELASQPPRARIPAQRLISTDELSLALCTHFGLNRDRA